MPVVKTASPKVSPRAPNAIPWKVRPSSRTRSAGGEDAAEASGRAIGCNLTALSCLAEPDVALVTASEAISESGVSQPCSAGGPAISGPAADSVHRVLPAHG